jgi:SAM-dependent methyltransferase
MSVRRDPDDGAAARARDRVVAYWDLSSPTYDESPGHATHSAAEHRAWLDALGALLPPAPADVLDVGTGTGFLALLLAELGHRVVGVDLAPGMLAVARSKAAALPAPPALLPDDAVAPPFPPHSFDAVTSRYLLWTLREPARALAAWRGLLRPGGTLVAIDGIWRPHGWQPDGSRSPEDWATFVARYAPEVRRGLPLAEAVTADRFVAVVAGAGFADVRLTPLRAIEELQRAHAGAAGDSVRAQFLIRARAP